VEPRDYVDTAAALGRYTDARGGRQPVDAGE
jgi:hypothetical protein